MLLLAPEETAQGLVPVRPFGLLACHQQPCIAGRDLLKIRKTGAHQLRGGAHSGGVHLHVRRTGIVVEGQRFGTGIAHGLGKAEVLAGDAQRIAGKHRIDIAQRIRAQRLGVGGAEIGERAGGGM